MGVRDCIIGAVEDGALSREEAESLYADYERAYEQRRLSLGDGVAEAQARADMTAALKAQALEKRRRANLTDAARLRVKNYIENYRGRDGKPDARAAALALLSHYGFRGTSSVRGREEAIVAMAHGKLADFMWQFRRRGLSGARRDKPLMSQIVRELKGEDTGNSAAKAFAAGAAEVMENLRQRFNNAGGAIPKLEGWGLPQTHDAEKIIKAGRQAWKAQIASLLDADKMLSPLTKQPIGENGLDAALNHVYDTIAGGGFAGREANFMSQGRGAVASQRQDSRFLKFKDAESWQKYNALFGRGDALTGIFEYINGMAKDVAAMEILGPNPAAMVNYLKNAVSHEYGLQAAGKASLAAKTRGPRGMAFAAGYQIESLYQALRGRPKISGPVAQAAGDIKNVITSAVLGSAGILSGVTDPFVARAGRALAGLPVTADMKNFLSMMKGQNRREILRSGVIWNDYMHLINDEARFAGMVLGSDWSKFLVDRSVMISGLKPLTTGRELVEARAWQAHIADESAKRFGALEPRFRAAMAGFGINEEDWRIFAQSVDKNGFVTPVSIIEGGPKERFLRRDLGGQYSAEELKQESAAARRREAAEKLAELLASWRERSVPAGSINSRALISGAAPRGTVAGEIADAWFQFKSFGLSFTAMQLEAMGQLFVQAGRGKSGAITAGKYLAAMVLPMTLGGALYTQLRGLLDGKDPAPMNTPAFWLQSMVTGGGFGLIGDYAMAAQNRFGQNLAESLAVGPAVSFVSDAAGVLSAGLTQPLGAQRNTGREAIKMLQRYTPIASSHWAVRGAYRHMIIDQLQYLIDPEANKAFKSAMTRAKNAGQPYFWPPGRALPARAPNF